MYVYVRVHRIALRYIALHGMAWHRLGAFTLLLWFIRLDNALESSLLPLQLLFLLLLGRLFLGIFSASSWPIQLAKIWGQPTKHRGQRTEGVFVCLFIYKTVFAGCFLVLCHCSVQLPARMIMFFVVN